MHARTQLATVRFKCFTYDPWPVTLTGSIPELGNWDPKSALPMQLEAEIDGCREWTGSIKCPLGQAIRFKFVENADWGPFWEVGENRTCCPSDPWMGITDEFRWHELREPIERGELIVCG